MGIDEDGDGKGEPVLSYAKPDVGGTYPIRTPAESDEFDGNEIGFQWQWHGNPKHYWAFPSGANGILRLNCIPLPENHVNMWDVPNLLLQKFPAEEFTATCKFNFNTIDPEGELDKAGLIIMGMDYAYLSVKRYNDRLSIAQVICTGARLRGDEISIEEQVLDAETLYFRVKTGPNAQCNFSYSLDGQTFIPIGNTFTAIPGRWIGAKVGLFAVRDLGENLGKFGYADFDWFRMEK